MASAGRASDLASLKATLGGDSPSAVAAGLKSVSGTVVGLGRVEEFRQGPVELDETFYAGAGNGTDVLPAGAAGASVAGRTTVLPRRRKDVPAEFVAGDARPRFDRVRELGQGAMGVVELARDNDIRRTVAVKRMLSAAGSDAALLRFADEVRIVGQLEHPGIVPVYDVGSDPAGDIYLVMKHLQGETMETVLDELRAGNAAYRQRFTIEQRVHVFLAVLDAVRYAHARGILHRDLKPANIMIGPYGEVTVMDWGIAKPIGKRSGTSAAEPLERTLDESHDQRLLETQLGALAGTPLYMSPEQAAGRNDDLDERSDVFALSVMFFEWLSLEHPLADKTTVTEVLAAIISTDLDRERLGGIALRTGVPMEYVYVVLRGVARRREERFQSVADLEQGVKRILDGHVEVRCHVTLAKSLAHRFTHWVDRHPVAYSALFGLITLSAAAGVVYGIYRAVRAFA